jgi:hypothetical protein
MSDTVLGTVLLLQYVVVKSANAWLPGKSPGPAEVAGGHRTFGLGVCLMPVKGLLQHDRLVISRGRVRLVEITA